MKKSKSISFTLEQIKKMPCAHLPGNIELLEKLEQSNYTEIGAVKKRSKYNNKKTEADGIVFDSQREARRYKELLLLLKAGEIGMLERQVPYELNPGGAYSYKYIADFVYIDSRTGNKIVEDVKGFRKVEYKKKRRLMKKLFGIVILET